MAVTLTPPELQDALCLTGSGEERPQVRRLLDVGTILVEKEAPDAPEEIQNEAVVLFVGYVFDAPTASPGNRYAAAFTNSGARALLLRWRTHRALSVAEKGE